MPKGPPPAYPQVTGPSHRRRMGDSNPRGLSPNTLSKCLNGGWDVFAGVRFRRSARCADSSHGPWMGLDREELLPKLLPLRGRGTGGVEPGSRPALGQAVAAPRPVESERSNFAADLRPCGQHAWRGTGGVEPGSRPALGQAVAAPR